MKIAYKIWLADEGKAFGKGPLNILKAVQSTGSLRQAALTLNISYTKAYQTIKSCEAHLPFKLMETQTGGKSGGGSAITEEALNLMDSYEGFVEEVDEMFEGLYEKHFEDLLSGIHEGRRKRHVLNP